MPMPDTEAAVKFAAWLTDAVRLRGLDAAVIERRWGYPHEMRKLVESTERHPAVRRTYGRFPEETGAYYEADDHGGDARDLFLGAAARAYFLAKRAALRGSAGE